MMLISKRSRRKSEVFSSRFREGGAGDFPLRQYLRCREDFTSGLVHTLLTVAFAVTLVIFARTLWALFDSHGADLNPAYRWVAMVLMGLFVLSVLRRLYYKVMELKEIRQEMARLQAVFREPQDEIDED
jgi:hypothetical protein